MANGIGAFEPGMRKCPRTVPVVVTRTVTSIVSPGLGSTAEARPPRPSGSETVMERPPS